MKRTLFVATLTFALVFALGGVAMADWGGASPTSFYNTEGSESGFSRERPVYVMWEDVLDTHNEGQGTWVNGTFFNSGEFNTPHKGYGTTTTLCAVCHSVHWAPVYDGNSRVSYDDALAAYDGAVADGTWSEKLLRSSAGSSCNYCHIETSIGGIQIYGGDASLYGYTQNFTSSFAHDYHGGASEGCTVCHAVHGANTFDGALGGKILHRETRPRATHDDRQPQPETIGELTNALDPTTGQPNEFASLYSTLEDAYTDMDDRWKQQTVFCSTCHYAYSADSETAFSRRGGDSYVKSHPMVEASATAGVAFAGSGTCRTCHDAGGVNQYKDAIDAEADNIDAATGGIVTGYSSNNFPHYTAGNYRFLDQDGLGMENKIDMSCLKCHQQGASGVGLTF